jgi:hypothetical protein
MPCHLADLIPGDRLEHRRGQAGELAQQPVAQVERVGTGRVNEFDVTGVPIAERCCGPTMTSPSQCPGCERSSGWYRTFGHRETRLRPMSGPCSTKDFVTAEGEPATQNQLDKLALTI